MTVTSGTGRTAVATARAVAIGALLAGALVALTPARPAAPATAEGRFLHLNIQGLLGRGSDGPANDIVRLNAASYVASRALDEGIIAVSLNEVCPVQAGLVRIAVHPTLSHHYASRFDRPYHSGAGNYCRNSAGRAEYGNAIYMRYSVQGFDAYYNGWPTTDPAADSRLWPNTVCMDTAAFLLTYHACTAHHSGRPSELTDLYNYSIFSGSRFRLAMGDLNQDRPGTGPFHPASTSHFREADHASEKRDTWDGHTAIDYIFIAKQHTSNGSNATITPLGYSDHHTIRGFFTLYW